MWCFIIFRIIPINKNRELFFIFINQGVRLINIQTEILLEATAFIVLKSVILHHHVSKEFLMFFFCFVAKKSVRNVIFYFASFVCVMYSKMCISQSLSHCSLKRDCTRLTNRDVMGFKMLQKLVESGKKLFIMSYN